MGSSKEWRGKVIVISPKARELMFQEQELFEAAMNADNESLSARIQELNEVRELLATELKACDKPFFYYADFN